MRERCIFFTCNCYTVSGVSVFAMLSCSLFPCPVDVWPFVFAQHLYILGGGNFGEEAKWRERMGNKYHSGRRVAGWVVMRTHRDGTSSGGCTCVQLDRSAIDDQSIQQEMNEDIPARDVKHNGTTLSHGLHIRLRVQ